MSKADLSLQGARILLVDDTPANLDVLCELLENEGARISMAPNGAVALKVAERSRPDLILLDILMPQMNGFQVCRKLKEDAGLAEIPIIFITAQDGSDSVVRGFEVGGVDYITKPFQDVEVLARVQTHLRVNRLNRALREKNEALETEIAQRKQLKSQLSMISQREAERWGLTGFVGASPTVERIFKQIRLMQENATTSVLINGESGTGKELIARAIHFGGTRSEGPFVPVNCAAMPGELVESLLFGHIKGAFTGAAEDKEGYFQMAHGGTLFLDEIGEMPLMLQAKLLRVLEDGVVQRIGEAQGRQVDVRVLTATNIDLEQRIDSGGFRQDLYFRLARFVVTAPPLRQRKEDIPLLAQHFAQLVAAEMGSAAPELDPEVLAALNVYDYPGNVRELRNIIERALIESRGEALRPYHLHFLNQGAAPAPVFEAASLDPQEVPFNLDEAERWLIRRALARTDGNVSEAARLLGTNRNKIYRVLAQVENRSL